MKWLEIENEMVGKWNGWKKMKWLKLKMKWLENENERDGKWKCNGGENCKLWE